LARGTGIFATLSRANFARLQEIIRMRGLEGVPGPVTPIINEALAYFHQYLVSTGPESLPRPEAEQHSTPFSHDDSDTFDFNIPEDDNG
jgi:hypothetical protein